MFIENAIVTNDYHVQFMSILKVLAASIDAKGPLTANHALKVNNYTIGIAGELGFNEAEVFDALTAKKHYRDALPSETAFEILEQGIGTRFDENIVEALKRYWEKQRSKQIKSQGLGYWG